MFSPPPHNCVKIYNFKLCGYMSCVCKRQWLLYRPTLVIRSTNLNTYDFKRLNSLMILSIYKEEVDNLDMKSIVKNFIKNSDVK